MLYITGKIVPCNVVIISSITLRSVKCLFANSSCSSVPTSGG